MLICRTGKTDKLQKINGVLLVGSLENQLGGALRKMTGDIKIPGNERNYICGLGARFEYERVEASIQTAATKVTNIVFFIY